MMFRSNNTGNVRITWHWEAFVQPLLQWKSSKYYIFWVCFSSLIYSVHKTYGPYYIVICGLSGCTISFHIIS